MLTSYLINSTVTHALGSRYSLSCLYHTLDIGVFCSIVGTGSGYNINNKCIHVLHKKVLHRIMVACNTSSLHWLWCLWLCQNMVKIHYWHLLVSVDKNMTVAWESEDWIKVNTTDKPKRWNLSYGNSWLNYVPKKHTTGIYGTDYMWVNVSFSLG